MMVSNQRRKGFRIYQWGIAVLVLSQLAGCAVRDRPRDSQKSARQDLVPSARAAEGLKPAEEGAKKAPEDSKKADSSKKAPEAPVAPAVEALHWTIREATPRLDAEPDSNWTLGSEVKFRELTQQGRTALQDPLEWPADENAGLVLQLANHRMGQWSAKCVLPRGQVETVLRAQTLEWDPKSQSGLIPLAGIFGPRGELRDPATLCHISVRLEKLQSDLLFSLRVLGRMPVLKPVDLQNLPLQMGVIRRERWVNPTDRQLQLVMTAEQSLTVSSLVRQDTVWFLNKGARQRMAKREFGLSSESRLHIEARLRVGDSWGEWSALPLQHDWLPRQEVQVEYRVLPAQHAEHCVLEEKELVRNPWANLRAVRRAYLDETHWTGKLSFHAQVSERLRWSDPSEYHQALSIPQALDTQRLPQLTASVCQGWH